MKTAIEKYAPVMDLILEMESKTPEEILLMLPDLSRAGKTCEQELGISDKEYSKLRKEHEELEGQLRKLTACIDH